MKKRLFAFLNNSVNKQFAESDILHRCSIGVGYANGYVAVPTEIAEVYGCKPSTVGASVTRSIQFLQRYFKKEL